VVAGFTGRVQQFSSPGGDLAAPLETFQRELADELCIRLGVEPNAPVARLIAAPLRETWHIHGVGLDGGETGTETLEVGSVVAFEPMFSVDEDAYYMEDMILVTETGHEILTKGLPYIAAEIEEVMEGTHRIKNDGADPAVPD